MINFFRFKNIQAGILFLLLTIILVSIWFWKGLLIGSGEVGVPFYSISYLAALSSHAWASPALGNATSINMVSLPFYSVVDSLSHVIHKGFLLQAFTYGFILLISFLSFFLWSTNKKQQVFASFFYIFNLVSIVLVWNRLQYSYMFFYALLPISFFLFVMGIEQKKIWMAFVINLLGLFLIVGFASLPLMELYWFILFLYVVFKTITQWQKKRNILFSWMFFVLTVFTWFIFHLWWIMQFLQILRTSSFITSTAYTTSSDINTLQVLSQQLGNLSYIFRLMHQGFFVSIKDIWGNIYFSPFFTLLSYLIPFLAYFPLVLRKKPVILYFFLGFSLLITLLMRGVAGPFGFLFLFFFSHIRTLEAFRNPFEKFGLALPFAYAPLVGYSLYVIGTWLTVHLKQRNMVIISAFFVLFLFIILDFPMWNGWIFTSTTPPSNNFAIKDYVAVPEYYKQANAWLNSDNTPFRVIALPMSGEGITQTWQYGYSGVEISNLLFDKPFISFSTSIQFLENITKQIQYNLFTSPESFTKIMSLLNAKYIMVRSDVDFRLRGMTNPSYVNNFLTTSGFTPIKKFGALTFYKNNDFLPKAYAGNTFYFASQESKYTDIFSLTDFQTGDVIFNNQGLKLLNEKTFSLSKNIIFQPEKMVNYSTFPIISVDEAKNQLPYISYLPGSKLYPLVRIKEYLHAKMLSTIDSNESNDISVSLKRLAELLALIAIHDTKHIYQATKDYIQSINDLQDLLTKYNFGTLDTREYERTVVLSEEVLLNNAKNNQPAEIKKSIDESFASIKKLAQENNMEPLFNPIYNQNLDHSRVFYRFNVLRSGSYDLSLKKENFGLFYAPLDNTIGLQIDTQFVHEKPIEQKDWIRLGNYYFDKGIHEIQFEIPSPKNLLKNPQDQSFSIQASDNATTKDLPILAFDPYTHYKVRFDYWIQKGTQTTFNALSDIDQLKQNSDIPFYSKRLDQDFYNHYYQSEGIDVWPSTNASSQAFSFSVQPYNDCIYLSLQSKLFKSLCEQDPNFYKSRNKQTFLNIENLRIERAFTNPIYLSMTNLQYQPMLNKPDITIKKIDASQYMVDIKNARTPFLLVFSETYHPLWEAVFTDSQKKVASNNHFLVNSFANAWYIDRSGNYSIILNFAAEKTFTLGKWISIIGIIIAIILMGIFYYINNQKHE